jgi:hypothetical protein
MREHLWSGLVSDLRFAVRSLRQRRGISLVVVATLTLGIGATSALFSVVYAVLLRPLPVAAPERVVMVYQQDRITGTLREPSSVPDYYDLVARARSFDALGAFTTGPMTIGGEGVEPASVHATRVTHGLFQLLGMPPRLGRDFTVGDDVPGGPKLVVLSDALRRSRFLADPGAVGRDVRLDDGLYTVVGVAPAGVELPGIATDLRVPLQRGPTSTPLAGGLALTRFLGSLLFGVAPTDPAVFAATAIALAVVGVVASGLPARRASRVDPMVALRSE